MYHLVAPREVRYRGTDMQRSHWAISFFPVRVQLPFPQPPPAPPDPSSRERVSKGIAAKIGQEKLKYGSETRSFSQHNASVGVQLVWGEETGYQLQNAYGVLRYVRCYTECFTFILCYGIIVGMPLSGRYHGTTVVYLWFALWVKNYFRDSINCVIFVMRATTLVLSSPPPPQR